MQCFSDIIVALGGYGEFAKGLGLPAGTASAMKTRDYIPARYWSDLVAFAASRGRAEITFEMLAGLAAEKTKAKPLAEASNEASA